MDKFKSLKFFKGGGSTSKGHTTSFSKSTARPPKWVTPFLMKTVMQADVLGNRPLKFYPGNQTAGFAPEQLEAQQRTRNRARSGSPLIYGPQRPKGFAPYPRQAGGK